MDVGRHQGTSQFNVCVTFCLLRYHHLFSFFLACNNASGRVVEICKLVYTLLFKSLGLVKMLSLFLKEINICNQRGHIQWLKKGQKRLKILLPN